MVSGKTNIKFKNICEGFIYMGGYLEPSLQEYLGTLPGNKSRGDTMLKGPEIRASVTDSDMCQNVGSIAGDWK